MLAKEWRF